MDVDVDVGGTAEVVLDVVEELDVEDIEELVGDSVTVGWTVEITVVPTTPLQVKNQYFARLGQRISNSQPTLMQTLPGMQHPPPKLSGQARSSWGQPDTFSPQTCPG